MGKLKLKLTFDKDCVTRPIIYELVKKYDVMTNILNANIEYGNRGNMILEIKRYENNSNVPTVTKKGITHNAIPLKKKHNCFPLFFCQKYF